MEARQIEDEKVKIIMSEYVALREEIRLLMNANIRDFQIFLGFLAAMFALSIKGSAEIESENILDIQMIISFIPFLFFAFSYFFLAKLSTLIITVAYVSNIENRINMYFDSKVLNWESLINPSLLVNGKSSFMFSSIVFAVLILVGYGISAWLGYFRFIPKHDFWKCYLCYFRIMYIGCPLLWLVSSVWMFFENKGLPKRVDDLFRNEIKGVTRMKDKWTAQKRR